MKINYIRKLVILIVCAVVLSNCAFIGPSIVKTYDSNMERNQIAIIRLEQKMSLYISSCDGIPVPKSARYLLVNPGRHELVFFISGVTLVSAYDMKGKKFVDAIGGHTYILKSETGFFTVGDKWFPVVIDVTDNPELHVKDIPQEEMKKDD